MDNSIVAIKARIAMAKTQARQMELGEEWVELLDVYQEYCLWLERQHEKNRDPQKVMEATIALMINVIKEIVLTVIPPHEHHKAILGIIADLANHTTQAVEEPAMVPTQAPH